MGRLRSENSSSPATVAVLQSFQQFCSVLFRRFVAAHNFKASSFFLTLDLHHELSAVCQGKFTYRVDEIANNTSNSPAQKRARYQVSPLYGSIDPLAPPLFRSRPGPLIPTDCYSEGFKLLMAESYTRCIADENLSSQCGMSFVQYPTTPTN